jgi:hypothetical protein
MLDVFEAGFEFCPLYDNDIYNQLWTLIIWISYIMWSKSALYNSKQDINYITVT